MSHEYALAHHTFSVAGGRNRRRADNDYAYRGDSNAVLSCAGVMSGIFLPEDDEAPACLQTIIFAPGGTFASASEGGKRRLRCPLAD